MAGPTAPAGTVSASSDGPLFRTATQPVLMAVGTVRAGAVGAELVSLFAPGL